jgi:hypothetical protein
MKLTIIPIDGSVYENNICYSNLIWSGTPLNVHALQWNDNAGWIEFNDGTPNENITVLPQWADNAMDAWTVANTPIPPSPPTAEQNKQTAIGKLQSTDWSATVDIANSNYSNPYLTNQNAFLAYRSEIRQVAVNPIAGNIDWAIEPDAIWSETVVN